MTEPEKSESDPQAGTSVWTTTWDHSSTNSGSARQRDADSRQQHSSAHLVTGEPIQGRFSGRTAWAGPTEMNSWKVAINTHARSLLSIRH